MWRLLGAGIAVVFIAIGSIWTSYDKSANYVPVFASISSMDRNCLMTITEGGAVREARESCSLGPGWEDIRNAPHAQRRKVEGDAVFTLSYTSPADGSQQTGTLKFTGSSTEFYDWQFGDNVEILAHKNEPGKIRRK